MLVPASSRTRRTRMTERHRRLVRETTLASSNFILPLFVVEAAANFRKPIDSMPGVEQLGIEGILGQCEAALQAQLGGVILFGIPEEKDEFGSEAYNDRGVIQNALREIKQRFPELLVATDVCLCEYTEHGHCGVIERNRYGEIEIVNDKTVELLVREAVSHAEAGSDLICPSDMMDGRVGAIRDVLDVSGFASLPIMSYSAKYASGLYGPFRDAAGSTPSFGDRRSHQMDVANTDEAMRVAQRDIEEGADIVMVKPAISSLDIIRRIREQFLVPVAAYQVSGEYSMIKAAGANGWIDEERVMMESLLSIKRAGASIILTYFALDAAKIL
ncbi:MAG TPA: porphobilinogen synthase [Candidatus Kapabacteria bacterium]|nr:porphobilinogen synthase [Candidatus Kapabacteria bacterium]